MTVFARANRIFDEKTQSGLLRNMKEAFCKICASEKVKVKDFYAGAWLDRAANNAIFFFILMTKILALESSSFQQGQMQGVERK